MFVSRSKFRRFLIDFMIYKSRLEALESVIQIYCSSVLEIIDQNEVIIDQNQSVIDINKIVLDKLEEYLKANDAHE